MNHDTMRHRAYLRILGASPLHSLSLELKGNFNELEGVAIMARMTNAEIVALEWALLVGNGVISSDEEIHTFAKWRELGYSVKRGEKACTSFMVWKHTVKKDKESGEESAAMFMKKAHFFSTSQVEKIAPVKRVDPSEYIGVKRTITLR